MPARRLRGIWATAARVPIALYRLGLGWVLGSRFLMIVHRGRRTRRRRCTVVEVARFDPSRDEYTVVAAFGPETDWYQNLMAHPAGAVHVGRRRFVPDQRSLSVDEADAVLAEYARKHPRLFPLLMRAVGLAYDGSPARQRELAGAMPMIAFRPRGESVSGSARRQTRRRGLRTT